MPRPKGAKNVKKVEVKKVEEPKVETPVVPEEPAKKEEIVEVAKTTAGAGFLSDVKVVTFEGAEVIAILEQKENEKLCRLSSGVTTWVPNSFFQNEKDEN